MLPTIEIGALRLNTYWLCYSLAILVTCTVAYRRLAQGGVTRGDAFNCLLFIFWGGLIGAFGFKIIVVALRDLALTGDVATGFAAGSAFLGALLGGIVGGWLWSRRVGMSLGRSFDLWVVPVPLGQAIGRLGCFAAGCCYGKPTDSWLGVYLPDHEGFWAVRYPTQLLSATADLLIFVILLRLEHWSARRSSPLFPGALFFVYLLLYAAKRFAIEFLRADTILQFGGVLTLTHLFYVILFLAALIVFIYRGYAASATTRAA